MPPITWPYAHVTLNHFPIILMVVGTAALIAAVIWRRRGLWLYAVATLTLAGLSIYPAYLTGDQAAHVLRGTWYIVPSAVREHDGAAGFALVSVLITGVVAAYTWWRMLRREPGALPPVWLRTTALVVTLVTAAIVARTAYLGGKIVIESPKLAAPPTGPALSQP